MDGIFCKMIPCYIGLFFGVILKRKVSPPLSCLIMVTYVFVWSVTVFIFFAANVTFYIITTTHAPNEMCRSELYYYISGFKMEEAEL